MRGVLFDYGLTLVSFSYPRAALLQVLETERPHLGPDAPDAATLMRTVLDPLEAALQEFESSEDEVDYLDFYEAAWRRAGVKASRAVLLQVLDAEQRCWDRAVRPAPGAMATLEALRGRGLRLGIASNAPFPPAMLHRQLEVSGFAERVDAAVFSSEVGRRKPAPDLYLAALERLGTGPADTLFVGDRKREDYDGPRAVGMSALLCAELARTPPPPGVPAIRRLPDLLKCDGL
ncbi:MAG: HAD family hydrolase [Candidatus Dormibacteraeota bacterium]|nr:HAD family hydrolase [Candidatus Dormibacteraeota bacterium]